MEMGLSVAVLICAAWAPLPGIAASGQPQFVAPTDQQELDARVDALRRQYASFLKSRPSAVAKRKQTPLPEGWTFAYEAKTTLKEGESAPQPDWNTVGFIDAAWIKTTVPEWRYRTTGSDTAMQPENKTVFNAVRIGASDVPSTICRYRTTFSADPATAGERSWLCFEGVDWEAQVWLNGEFLGKHCGYMEPFRFEVTGKLKPENTLAVRVLDGPAYGEPVSYASLFPMVRAAEQRYVPDRASSIRGNLSIDYHCGTGFGIHRRVYVERSGPVLVSEVFVRNNLSEGKAAVRVELNSREAVEKELEVEILPENFGRIPLWLGKAGGYSARLRCALPKGSSVQTLEIPMPEAKVWSPETPYLYRARVRVAGDVKDAVFGCRSFSLAPAGGAIAAGIPILNGKPLHLRGANVYPLHTYWYWGQHEELLKTLLMVKAANFNAVRCVQHIEFPEVREIMDRLGILSEQDQPGGRGGDSVSVAATTLRACYNNPGVVFISFINEHASNMGPIMQAAAPIDPDRMFIPISGTRWCNFDYDYNPPVDKEFHSRAVDDMHDYRNWYDFVNPGTTNRETWKIARPWARRQRVATIGEYGAEALDSYATMRDHYPPQMKPPAPETDTLWAAAQVAKDDVRQHIGLGRIPKNLGEYIEASQNFQEAALADQTIGMRLSPRSIGGYFLFHFIDVVPVTWPKSIVSFDHRPKRAYFQMSQINQPVVALPQLTGERPDAMTLWVANDLPEALPGCTVDWSVMAAGKSVLCGEAAMDVPALEAAQGPQIDLSPITATADRFDLELVLKNKAGEVLSRYRREVRCVPSALLVK
jgi:beta-mannosidase